MTNPFDSIDARLSNIETLLLDLSHSKQPTTAPAPTNPEPVRLFGDRAAASYLGCSVMTIQSLRRNGNIPFYRTGRKIIYISNELDQALQVKARKFQKTK